MVFGKATKKQPIIFELLVSRIYFELLMHNFQISVLKLIIRRFYCLAMIDIQKNLILQKQSIQKKPTRPIAMKKYYFLLALLCSFYSSHSQSWLWGRNGGSTSNTQEDEAAESMFTDPDGNVYLRSVVDSGNLHSGGTPLEAGGGMDGLITSFGCDGAYRWSKVIGGAVNDKLQRIAGDAQGNVYAVGNLSRSHEVYFKGDAGNELVLPPYADTGQTENQRNLFLVKYNQAGEMQWVRFPQADDITFFEGQAGSTGLDLDVSPNGHTYWLVYIPSGSYANGAYTVTGESGIHIFEYDTQGEFVTAMQLDIQVTGVFPQMKLRRNHATGRFYLGGYFLNDGTATFGGEVFEENKMFLSAFDADGNFLWNKINEGVVGRIRELCVDVDDAVYIAGVTDEGETFAGYTLQNQGIGPFIMKLTADGDAVWGSSPMGQPVYAAYGITINGSEVAITGMENGLMWGDFALQTVNDRGTDPYMVRFDKNTGSVLGIEKLEGTFIMEDWGTSITADAAGNYYLGGAHKGLLYTGPDTLGNGGGGFNFFVAKFGTDNCDCALPQPSFSFAEGDASYAFNYNGGGYDTIAWDFGDGGTSSDEDPYHYFAQGGPYEVCVTVTNECGSENYCSTVNAVMGTGSNALALVKVYPNPVQDVLTITADTPLAYTLYSILGSKVGQGTVSQASQVIATGGLSSGVYLLKLKNEAGSEKVVKIVRE